MSLLLALSADILVAVLLVAAIVASVRLSRRIGTLKDDEAALRRTIVDLMTASSSAERAIAGLRTALDEHDRTLAGRLAAAERVGADLAAQVGAGETVLGRIGAIVGQVQSVRADAPVVRPAAPPAAATHGERLDATAAAALAMTERALGRVRARAA